MWRCFFSVVIFLFVLVKNYITEAQITPSDFPRIHTEVASFSYPFSIGNSVLRNLKEGDLNNDGFLDLIYTEYWRAGTSINLQNYISALINNGDGTFTKTVLVTITSNSVNDIDIGDYDNDGDLDIVAVLTSVATRPLIYKNDDGVFSAIKREEMSASGSGSVNWVDYDLDGDLDLFTSGSDNGNYKSILYTNLAGVYLSPIEFPGLSNSTSLWADFNSDTRPDLLYSGKDINGDYLTYLFINGEEGFLQSNYQMPTFERARYTSNDFNGDGLFDLTVTGKTPEGLDFTALYLNENGAGFAESDIGLLQVSYGVTTIADIDNDFTMDMLTIGSKADGTKKASVTGQCTDCGSIFGPGGYAEALWLDIDNDGDLDLATSGAYSSTRGELRIYRNDFADIVYDVPEPPNALSAELSGRIPTLSWEWGNEFSIPEHQYGFDIWLEKGGVKVPFIYQPSIDPETGRALLNRIGKLQGSSIELMGLAPGTYSWQVQAVDYKYLRSELSELAFFTIEPTMLDLTGYSIDGQLGESSYDWTTNSIRIKVAPDADLTQLTASFELPEGTLVKIEEVEQISGETINDFSESVIYKITNTENESHSYWQVDVETVAQFTSVLENPLNYFVSFYTNTFMADLDNDDELELFITSPYGTNKGGIYDINSGVIEKKESTLSEISGRLLPFDVDLDGDVDLQANRLDYGLLRNTEGDFLKEPLGESSSSLYVMGIIDIDNDGWQDVVYQDGYTALMVAKNRNGVLGTATRVLSPSGFVEIDIVDIDKDGDEDIVGNSGALDHFILLNNNGVLTPYGGDKQWTYRQSVVDIDNNGFLDIGVGSFYSSGLTSYLNNGITFDEKPIFKAYKSHSIDWGDYNSDGFYDLLTTGSFNGAGSSKLAIFDNKEGEMVLGQDYPDQTAENGYVKWLDINSDGRLDVFVSGTISSSQGNVTQLYRNNLSAVNFAPAPPQNLATEIFGGKVRFSWDDAIDDHTPVQGMTYDISVGTQENLSDIVSASANPTSGVRVIQKKGRLAGTHTFLNRSIRHLPEGTYYWKVLAMDGALQSSEFSEIGTFEISYESTDFLTYAIDGQLGAAEIDWEAKTIFVSMPADADLTSLQPIFETKESAMVLVDDVLQVSGESTLDFTNSVIYTIKGLDDAEDQWEVVARAKSEETKFLGFSIPEQSGTATIDGVNSKVTITLPYGLVLETVTPEFVASEGAIVSLGGLIQKSGESQIDFSYSLKYGINSEAGSQHQFWEVKFVHEEPLQTTQFLEGIYQTKPAWADYDLDGDLDLALVDNDQVLKLYENDQGELTLSDRILPTGVAGPCAWDDYDGNGYPDIVCVIDEHLTVIPFDGTDFLEGVSLADIVEQYKTISVSDVNNDTYYDLILTDSLESVIYFSYSKESEADSVLTIQHTNFNFHFDDFNLDGQADFFTHFPDDQYASLLISKSNGFDTVRIEINSSVEEINVLNLNNDKLPDLIVTYWLNDVTLTNGFFINNQMTFDFIDLTGFPVLSNYSFDQGDFDSDGINEIILSGKKPLQTDEFLLIRVEVNASEQTTATQQLLSSDQPLYFVDWLHLDDDSNLDLAVYGNEQITLFENEIVINNEEPQPPENLRAAVTENNVSLFWDNGDDEVSPSELLHYTLRIGTNPESEDVRGSFFSLENGRPIIKSVVPLVSDSVSFKIAGNGKYYWSLQSVDAGRLASPFSEEATFTVGVPGFVDFSIAQETDSIIINASGKFVKIYVNKTTPIDVITPVFELTSESLAYVEGELQESGVSEHSGLAILEYLLTTGDSTNTALWTAEVVFSNLLPNSLTISTDKIEENNLENALVAILEGLDDDDVTLTYSLIADTLNNNKFKIEGNELLLKYSMDYETSEALSVLIAVKDSYGGVFSKRFEIVILDVNEAPTAVSLSNNLINENLPAGSLIGQFVVEDEDIGDEHTVTLTNEDAVGSLILIDGMKLLTRKSFNYEELLSFNVEVDVRDGEYTISKSFEVTLVDLNDAPAGLDLVAEAIVEKNDTIGSVIGEFVVEDEDHADGTFVLTIIDASYPLDKALFGIKGQSLVSNLGIDNRNTPFYSITVEAKDTGGLRFLKDFNVNVVKVNEPIVDIALTSTELLENNTPGALVGQLLVTDNDLAKGKYSYTITNEAKTDFHFSARGELFVDIATDFEQKEFYTLDVEVEDGEYTLKKSFRIAVMDDNEAPTALSLSNKTIQENAQVGSLIGEVAVNDPDFNSSYTLSITNESQLGGMVFLEGNQLFTRVSMNYENTPSILIEIKADDGKFDVSGVFEVSILDISEAPSSISLTNTAIEENLAAGTLVGQVTIADEDSNNAHTIVIANKDDVGNMVFLEGDQLYTMIPLNFETQPSFSLELEVVDGDFSISKGFDITIVNVNDAPTALGMTSEPIVTKEDIEGSIIGVFEIQDEDAHEEFDLTLVAASFPVEEALFSIDGLQLVNHLTLDNREVLTYDITVEAKDKGGSVISQNFTILVEEIANPLGTQHENSSVIVFPNPASDVITLKFDSSVESVATVSILSMDGRLMYSDETEVKTERSRLDIEVGDFPRGVYILIVEGSKNTRQFKIILNHGGG